MDIRLILIVLGAAVITGCRIIAGGAAVTVGTVAITGYTVYQGGKLAAVSVQKATERGKKGVGSVVYSGGEFKTVCHYNVDTVAKASYAVFRQMGFRNIKGNFDALSGFLNAETIKGEDISLRLNVIENNMTDIQIKVGIKGNLKNSEIIYDRILSVLEGGTK